eukprot:5748950-Pyramimonas_sp.AAC.1
MSVDCHEKEDVSNQGKGSSLVGYEVVAPDGEQQQVMPLIRRTFRNTMGLPWTRLPSWVVPTWKWQSIAKMMMNICGEHALAATA